MAANLDTSRRFLVDTTEINLFDRLSVGEQAAYRFHRSPVSQRTEYVFMQIGYGYFCALARQLWPFGGDTQAIILLQALVHIGLCLWLLWLLPTGWRQAAFIVLYACNPLIVRYVTYDFYYFWQVIPSFLFVGTYLGWRGASWVGLWIGPLLGLLFVVRPSMVGALLGLGCFWAYRRQVGLLLVVASLALCVAVMLYRPVQSAPWRPIYVGIAAYQNPHMNNLSDVAIHDLYKARTGHAYQYGSSDLAQEKQLTDVLQAEVKTLWEKSPGLFVGHALLNTLLAYSTGYVAGGGDALNYTLALLGLMVLAWLLWKRRYIFVWAILATVGTFTLYYPPIPAYMYGAYLLLAMAFVAPGRKRPAV